MSYPYSQSPHGILHDVLASYDANAAATPAHNVLYTALKFSLPPLNEMANWMGVLPDRVLQWSTNVETIPYFDELKLISFIARRSGYLF